MNCLCCNNIVESKDKKAKFCCRSCSAKVNGKLYPKRKLTKKCRGCDSFARTGRSFCDQCIENGRHLRNGQFITERTLGEEIDRIGKTASRANIYRGIRTHSYIIMKGREKKCDYCGYNKHVEVAHIKAISKFELNTKIEDINSPNNLIYLCPNCHWEHDNKN